MGTMGRRGTDANVLIFMSSRRRRSPVVPCATSTRVLGIVSESGLMRLLQLVVHDLVHEGRPVPGASYLIIAWIICGSLAFDIVWLSPNFVDSRQIRGNPEAGSRPNNCSPRTGKEVQSGVPPQSRVTKSTYRPWEARLEPVVHFVRVLRNDVMPTSRSRSVSPCVSQ